MRKPMITRTVISTKVLALVVDTETATTSEQEFILPRKVPSDKQLKVAQKLFGTDTTTIVAIRKSEEVEQLYGMYENDFINFAMPLNTVTRKPIPVAVTENWTKTEE